MSAPIRRAVIRITETAQVRGERISRHHLDEVRESADDISRRLQELDREWDAERAMELGAAALGLVGLGLIALRRPLWAAVSGLASVALLRHALSQRSLTVELLGRFGLRSREEIIMERIALKAMRGDFRWVTPVGEGGDRLDPDTAYLAAEA